MLDERIVKWFNRYFNPNKWDRNDLKTELGFLSVGRNEPVVDKCADSLGAEYNSRLYIEIENTLEKLAKEMWLEMDESLERRVTILEKLFDESTNKLDIGGDTYDKLASMLHSMDLTKMRRALNMGADPNMSSVHQNNGNGCTAIRTAAIFGEYDAVKLLVEAGANVNMKDTVGKTPLDYAMENDHEDVVDLLLNSGARSGSSLIRLH